MITYDDFKKIELKTAKILKADRIDCSDRLLKLEIQVGEETRQLIAGIGKAYQPDVLIDTTIIIVANLESKTFTLQSDSGQVVYESQGMLLAASQEGGAPVLLTTMGDVASGADIK